MKKIFITLMMTVVAMASFAQTKTDTVKKTDSPKPVFNADMQKPRTVMLSAADALLLITSPDQWKSLEWSNQHSAAQVSQFKADADKVRERLKNQIDELISADQKAFTADTIAANAKKNTDKGKPVKEGKKQ